LISLILPPFFSCLRRRYGLREYEELEWCMNETFQLQRLAHEEVGLGTWSRTTDFIPVTKPCEELALLDLSYPDHPRLSAPLILTPVDSVQKSVEEPINQEFERVDEPDQLTFIPIPAVEPIDQAASTAD
jgi:hypothetical protein